MNKTSAKDAMRELSMVLIYLSRFAEGERFEDATDFRAWKGYNFNVLNELEEADYIWQGNHPSRSKSVYITEDGKERARELMEKYGIADWI